MSDEVMRINSAISSPSFMSCSSQEKDITFFVRKTECSRITQNLTTPPEYTFRVRQFRVLNRQVSNENTIMYYIMMYSNKSPFNFRYKK